MIARRLQGEVNVINEHFDKLAGSGGPEDGDPRDPRNRDKWKSDIARHLREMGRQIDRITGDRNRAPWQESLRRLEEQFRNLQ